VGDLLDAIDELTKPVVLHFPQVGDDGKWLRAHTTQLPSLLAQLEAAIHSSISGKAGGGDPATRAVLNSDALFEFARIRSTLGDWCRIEKVRVTRDVSSDLRRWYVARLTRETDDEFYVRELVKWAGIIRYRLEPACTWEVDAACPTCKKFTWTDTFETPEGAELEWVRNRPILVEYRLGARDILSASLGTCRACGAEWKGSSGLRSMRWDIDHAEDEEEREAS
jgi:hypothetical protein